MTEVVECTGNVHQFPIEFKCTMPDCKFCLLCISCLEIHKETQCSARFGRGILKIISDTPQGENEGVDSKMTTPKAIVKEQENIRDHTLEEISAVLDFESEIHEKNKEKLTDLLKRNQAHYQEKILGWIDHQEEMLRKRSDSQREGLFSRLEELSQILGLMNFDKEDLLNNYELFNRLNFEIVPETKKLIALANQAMNDWGLIEDRLKDFSEMGSRFVQGLEFSSLLNPNKFEYNNPNLAERFEEVGKLKQEIEALEASSRAQKFYIVELEKKDQGLDELRVTNEELTRQVQNFDHEKDGLQKANGELLNERNALRDRVEALEGNNRALASEKDAADQEKNTAIQEKEALKTKAENLENEIKNGANERDDLVKKVEALEVQIENLKNENNKMMNERDVAVKEVEALKAQNQNHTNDANRAANEQSAPEPVVAV